MVLFAHNLPQVKIFWLNRCVDACSTWHQVPKVGHYVGLICALESSVTLQIKGLYLLIFFLASFLNILI